MKVTAPLVALLLGLAATACGDDPVEPPPPPPDSNITSFAIGGGNEDGTAGFVGLEDGQEVTLVPGAQGGFHMFVNVRLGFEETVEEHITLERTARKVADNKLVSKANSRVDLVPSSEDGYHDSDRPMLMFLCPSPVGISVLDGPLVLRFQVLAEEEEATQQDLPGAASTPKADVTIKVQVRCPESQQSFCEQICTG